MIPCLRRVLLLLALVSPALGSGNDAAWATNGLTVAQFESLATELAPKVNLFRETWAQVPDAEFTGGTVRDYFYWLRAKLAAAKNSAELEKAIAELRGLAMIDVRAFVHEESDIDYAAHSGKRANLNPADFGVKKLDAVDFSRFVPGTPAHESELLQGYIPIEKVLLSRSEVRTAPGFGDGVSEIFSGKPSVHFTDLADFARSIYAKVGANHRILLVMRYLRTLSLNYAKTGHELSEVPEIEKLLADVDPNTRNTIRNIISGALDGKELKAAFKNASFAKWYRGTLEKSFRAYVHPTATHLLYTHFGLDRIVAHWPDKSIQINQFVYAKPRLPRHLSDFNQRIRALGFEPDEVLNTATEILGNDRFLYHGTRGEEAFRDILLRGIVASGNGTAGPGVYGVPENKKEFAAKWGGKKENLIRFQISKDARILDLTSKNPKTRAFIAAAKARIPYGGDVDVIAEYFGLDLVKYPYQTEAFVVKNSAVLGRPAGVHRSVLTFNQILEQAGSIRSARELHSILESVTLNGTFTTAERELIFKGFERSPAILNGLREIEARAFTDPHQAKSFFMGIYSLMLVIAEGNEAKPSRRFLENLVSGPALRLPYSGEELEFFTSLFTKSIPPGFTSQMRTRLAKIALKGNHISAAANRSFQSRGKGPWQVYALVNFLLGFGVAATIGNDDEKAVFQRYFVGGTWIVMNAWFISMERKNFAPTIRDAREMAGRVRALKSMLRGIGLADSSPCSAWLSAAEREAP